MKVVGWWSALMTGLHHHRRGGGTIEDAPHDLGTIWQGPKATTKAASIDAGDTLRICFRNYTDETLLLCWVDESGIPYHFYKLHPFEVSKKTTKKSTEEKDKNQKEKDMVVQQQQQQQQQQPVVSNDEHIETTCVGHAFLLARADDVEECAARKSLNWATLVGAYRAKRVQPLLKDSDDKHNHQKPAAIDDDKILHLVTVHDRRRSQNKHAAGSATETIQRLRGCCQPKNENNDDDDDALRYYLEVCTVELDSTPLDTTTKVYEKCTLGKCQWPVMAEPNWDNGDEAFRACMEQDLDCAIQYLPEHCRSVLRDELPTPIWINKTIKYGPKSCPVVGKGACFHPEPEWLLQNGMHPEKCKCVELYNMEDYKSSRTLWGTGGLLLHEFSHAYHNKCLEHGYDNSEILECYRLAMKDKLYEKVRVKGPQGPTNKAYACNNAMEYFAELSAAFLGGIDSTSEDEEKKEDEFNKWYPFNRQQIREHDPRAYEMLKKMWKVED